MNQSFFKKVLIVFALLVLVFQAKSALALTLTPIRLEIAGDAGQTLDEQMTIINERPNEQTYYSSYSNFEAQGETGTPTFVDAHDDLGTWIQAPTSVTLKAGESKIVDLKIAIPKNADAGGHFAAIFWGASPTGGAGQVSIGAKTGMLVLLRVNGPIDERGGILDFVTKNKQTYFTSRPVTFYYRFQNNGTDRIKPTGKIIFKDMLGLTADKILANPIEGNILPKSIRKFEVSWQGADGPDLGDLSQEGYFGAVKREWRNFAFGYYTAHLNTMYGIQNETATAVFSFWVFPWQLLLFIILLALFGFFGGRFGLRHYNAWIIGQAQKNMQRAHDTQHEHDHASQPE